MLTEVLTANPRSDGYASPSKLSAELKQVVVAQGSTKLDNTSPLTSYYGYDNNVLNVAGAPQMLPTPTSRKCTPTRNAKSWTCRKTSEKTKTNISQHFARHTFLN